MLEENALFAAYLYISRRLLMLYVILITYPKLAFTTGLLASLLAVLGSEE